MDKARDNVDEKILANLAGDTKTGDEEPLDFATEEEEDELEQLHPHEKRKRKKSKSFPRMGNNLCFNASPSSNEKSRPI